MALNPSPSSPAVAAFRSRSVGRLGGWAQRWEARLQLIVAAVALALGFWGWMLKEPPTGWDSLFNGFFRTLQLLTLQFPREVTGGVPWQLQVARFLLPLVALLWTYRVVLGSVRRPIRLALVGLWKSHVVVTVGSSATGLHVLRQVRRHRRHVVAIATGMAEDETALIEEQGIAVLAGDPRAEEAWHAACADRAAAVILAQGSDIENLNAAVTMAVALRTVRRRPGPTPNMIVLIENDALAQQVDAALDEASRDSGFRYRRLSGTDEAVRELFLDPPLPERKGDRSVPSHILVLGLGPGGTEVLRAALTMGQDASGAPPFISVLADAEEIAAQPLLAEAAIPGFIAALRVTPCTWRAGLPADGALHVVLEGLPPVTLACVCLENEAALLTGLALARMAENGSWPPLDVCVYQREEDRFLTMLSRSDVPFANRARLRPFGGLLPEKAVSRMLNGHEEVLPRAVHAHYLAEMARQDPAAPGTRLSWDDLPENLRHANRASADHIAVKLATIGCRIVEGGVTSAELSSIEIGLLSEIEHRRWAADRILHGWRWGSVRDNRLRLHPDLIPYEALTEDVREKDRAAIRALPEVLRIADLGISREQASSR